MLARVIDALSGAESADLPHLRALSYGGGKMPQSVIERAMKLFPDTDFANAYGLTETSSTISILGPDDHRTAMSSDDPAVRRRIVSVGQPLPTLEVQIRDDAGNVLGPNERGEIYVRGEQVSGEYLGKGSQLLDDGFFPTRDGGSMDAEGYLFLEGRIDDIIVRGGENMSPGEIEDVLLEHPAVADAAVVGVPDEQWGEAVAAVVVCKAGSVRLGRRTQAVGQGPAALFTHAGDDRVLGRAAVQRDGQAPAPQGPRTADRLSGAWARWTSSPWSNSPDDSRLHTPQRGSRA